jgi:hypothetical protein
VDFKRISNNEEQSLTNLINVQEGLVGKHPDYRKIEIRRFEYSSFDLSLMFWP